MSVKSSRSVGPAKKAPGVDDRLKEEAEVVKSCGGMKTVSITCTMPLLYVRS